MRMRIFKIVIITILIIAVLTTMVSALTFNTSMTPSSTNVDAGTEFTVTFKVSNLDVGANGINTLNGTLKYDEDVFEEVTDNSIEGMNTWSPSYNATNGSLTLTKTTFVKTEEMVFQITLKTKADLANGKTGKISFSNIKASNSEQEIVSNDISTTITIGAEDTNNVVNNTNNSVIIPVVNNTVRNNNVPVNNDPVPSYTNNTNYYNDTMPYTGAEDTMVYLIGGAVILAIVFYIKFEKVNGEM